MSKKSDFAQKLLDDIRRRKEKLGCASSSSSSSQQPTQTIVNAANRKSQKSFQQHSRDRTMTAAVGSQNREKLFRTEAREMWFDMRNSKPTSKGGTSQDIVPVGTDRSAQNSVDVSMALALLLSYSGKLQNAEPFITNRARNDILLHYGSIYFNGIKGTESMKRTRYHTGGQCSSSSLQINEVSKGVQNLNKILEMCSRRMHVGINTTEVGRELLKGAINLEESLRLLMNVQEASNYMVGSRGTQVRLLKNKEEEDGDCRKTSKKNVNDMPSLPFNRSSRYLQKPTMEGLDTASQGSRKLGSFPYSEIETVNNTDQSYFNSSIPFNSHRRSHSSSSIFMSDSLYTGAATNQAYNKKPVTFSNSYCSYSNSRNKERLAQHSNHGNNSNNVRIPSVIAKLMGLEELPPLKADIHGAETQYYHQSKKETVPYQFLKIDGAAKKEVKFVERNFMRKGKESKILQEKPFRQNKAEKIIEVSQIRGKANSAAEKMNGLAYAAARSHSELENQLEGGKVDHNIENKKSKKHTEAFKEKKNNKDQKQKAGKIFQVFKKATVQKQLKPTKASSEEQYGECRLKEECSKDPEIGKVDVTLPRNLVNHPNIVPQEKISQQKIHTYETSGNKVLLTSKNMVISEQLSAENADYEQSKDHWKRSFKEKQIMRNRSSTSSDTNVSTANRRPENAKSKNKTAPKTDKITVLKALATLPDEPVDSLPVAKVDIMNNKIDRDQYLNTNLPNVEIQCTETTNEKCKQFNQQASHLHQSDLGWKEKTRRPEQVAENSQETYTAEHLKHAVHPTQLPSSNSVTEAQKNVKSAEENLLAKNNSGNLDKGSSDADQSRENSVRAELELPPHEPETQGPGRIKTVDNEPLQSQNKATSEVARQVSLNKKQHSILQKLSYNKLFLNTVQRMFRVKVPIVVLEESDITFAKDESKLLSDCGLELVRKKAEREPVTCTISKSYYHMRTRCLEGLINELTKDLEYLESTSKSTDHNDDSAEFLHLMLERDIQNAKPDINCMWDYGWNCMKLAPVGKIEIAKDMEKHLLNGLINDLLHDLLNGSITASS